MAPTPPPERPVRVLLIDDDRDDYLLTRDLFSELPAGRFVLDWVPGFQAGLDAMARGEHDIYLVDYLLDARTGLELLQEARRRDYPGPVILLTGTGRWEIDHAALQAGAADYLEKARLDATLLDRAIRYALHQSRYEADLADQVRRRTDELARANAALLDADRRKNEFLGTLGHELRNPLAPIRNAVEIMRLAPDRPDIIQHSRLVLDRQVKHLGRLVDDLLDVSRVARGSLSLSIEEIDLAGPLELGMEQARPALDKAGVLVEIHPRSGPLMVRGDRVRLAQVVANLLSNAAKYTPEGGRVTVSMAREGTEACLRVRDTGAGIPPAMLRRIFELFTPVDRELKRLPEGLGVSLAISARIVELHGGRIEAHSAGLGQGAEFAVSLPLVG